MAALSVSSRTIQCAFVFLITQRIHLIPKWRIIVTWPSMPRFRAALPRSSRATAILEFILFIHSIYFATDKLQCGKRKQIMTSVQDSDTLKVIRNYVNFARDDQRGNEASRAS